MKHKPTKCPLCGKVPAIVEYSETSWSVEHESERELDGTQHYIVCFGDSAAAAIENWRVLATTLLVGRQTCEARR